MSPDELDKMERLWRGCMPVSRIAKALGYSEKTVNETAMANRGRFPYRKKRVPRAMAEYWAGEINAGRASVAGVAKRLGVHPTTVFKWTKERR